jgi:hypothetical protein
MSRYSPEELARIEREAHEMTYAAIIGAWSGVDPAKIAAERLDDRSSEPLAVQLEALNERARQALGATGRTTT